MSALICSWCSLVMRVGSLPASHGICEACAVREFAAAEETA